MRICDLIPPLRNEKINLFTKIIVAERGEKKEIQKVTVEDNKVVIHIKEKK